MGSALETSLRELTDIQRRAVEWDDGPLLVLAGPGSGKTRVLTCRVAGLLESSRKKRFRILALTFTNKAAHEMANRVTRFAPGLEGRADISTFHGFCAQVLRQHGVHLGIKPNFAIHSQTSDRQAVLADALRRDPRRFGRNDQHLLPLIDAMKARLVVPEQATPRIARRNGASPNEADRVVRAYRLYEGELHRTNALDFNSLILKAYELFRYPAMARHYQTVYRYWLVDEFQDTNGAQYALLRRMAGENFRQLFAVADDDQTIYEWNGANVRRIRTLVDDFSCHVVQLTTNFRCPPNIVEAANRLVVYNARRATWKQPAQSSPHAPRGKIEFRVFATDEKETAGIAAEIARGDKVARTQTAVLARTRALLESMREALDAEGVSATVLMRRDDFASPEMRWLVAGLKQIDRPLDERNLRTLVETFDSFAALPLDYDELISRAAADRVTLLSVWTDAAREAGLSSPAAEAVSTISNLAAGNAKLAPALRQILGHFENHDPHDDLKDDLGAWRRIEREIRDANGFASLDRFLQELEMRSKEPVPVPGSVSLATIHGAKGLEFDTVYLVGMAEEILPSWHSLRKGRSSAALEEERRGCFVAITRTKQRLILSRARQYKGWRKEPSRFLEEMGLLNDGSDSPSQRGRRS